MTRRLMVLPSQDPARIRLVTVPQDLGLQEAYRLVTGLVAEVEDAAGEEGLADVLEALEGRGFEPVDFALGPALD
jgi:hypothetical protein